MEQKQIDYSKCATAEAAAEELLRVYQQQVSTAKTLAQLLKLVTTDKLAQDIAQLAAHFQARGEGEWGYETLIAKLEEAPLTYLPALLIRVVQLCEDKKVFREGGLLEMVKKAQEQAKADAVAMGRTAFKKGAKEWAEENKKQARTGRSKNKQTKFWASFVKPGDTVECECGSGHVWRTTAVAYGESWQPRRTRCSECGGVYLVAKQVVS